MDPRTFPTKGNLMLAKNSLALAKQGYDLMDKKRNILIRELMDLIDEARTIQEEIDTTFTYAYQCLQRANIENGISNVELLAYTVPIENSITIQTRSIMGTEIPHVIPGLPVGEGYILREVTAPEGFEVAEDVTFNVEDTTEIQTITMEDEKTPDQPEEPEEPDTPDEPDEPTPSVPQTGGSRAVIWVSGLLILALLGLCITVPLLRHINKQ